MLVFLLEIRRDTFDMRCGCRNGRFSNQESLLLPPLFLWIDQEPYEQTILQNLVLLNLMPPMSTNSDLVGIYLLDRIDDHLKYDDSR
jgi:hypothetical protein